MRRHVKFLSLFMVGCFFSLAAAGDAPVSITPPPAPTGTVSSSRTISTGTATTTGLSGGGTLASDLSLSCVNASATSEGCVSTGAQTIAGAKTFSSGIIDSATSGNSLDTSANTSATGVAVQFADGSASTFVGPFILSDGTHTVSWNSSTGWSFNGAGIYNNGSFQTSSGVFQAVATTALVQGDNTAAGPAIKMASKTTLTSGDILELFKDNGVTQVANIDFTGKGSFNGGVAAGSGGVQALMLSSGQFQSQSTSGVQFNCTGAATCQVGSSGAQIYSINNFNTGNVLLGNTTGGVTVQGSLLNSTGNTYNIGSATNSWSNLFINRINDVNGSDRLDFTGGFGAGAVAIIGQSAATAKAVLITNQTTLTTGHIVDFSHNNGATVDSFVDSSGNFSGGFVGVGNHDLYVTAYDPLSGVTTTGLLAQAGATSKAATLVDANYVQNIVGTGGTTLTAKLCDTSSCGTTIFATVTPTCTAAVGTVTTATINTSAIPSGTVLNWVITSTTCTTDSGGMLTAHLKE